MTTFQCLTLTGLAAMSLAVAGCNGSSSGSASGSVSSTTALATLGGSVTRVNGATTALGGIPVKVFQVSAVASASSAAPSPLGTASTDSSGNFTIAIPAGSEVEVEISGDADDRITITAPGTGEHLEVRCHVDESKLSAFAVAGDADRAEVECHMSGSSGARCKVGMARHAGTTHASMKITGAPAHSTLSLMARPSSDPTAPLTLVEHVATDASGSASVDVPASLEANDLELDDASGAALLQGTLAKMPASSGELGHRHHGHATIAGTGSVVMEVESESDDEADACEIRVSGLTPNATADVRMETAAGSGVLATVGTVRADGQGRARLRMGTGGSTFPAGAAHASDLAHRRCELRVGTTTQAAGELPEAASDF